MLIITVIIAIIITIISDFSSLGAEMSVFSVIISVFMSNINDLSENVDVLDIQKLLLIILIVETLQIVSSLLSPYILYTTIAITTCISYMKLAPYMQVFLKRTKPPMFFERGV